MLIVLKRIFLYYPVNYSIVTLLRIVGFAGFGMLSGVFIKQFFDQTSEHTLSLGSLYYITAILIAVPLVQAATYYLDLHLSYGWVEIIRAYFRRNIFRQILNKRGALPLPVNHGQFMNVMRSDVTIHEGILWDLSYLIAYAVFSMCGLVILGSIDLLVTVILFAPLLFTVIVVNWMERKITSFMQQEQKATDHVTGILSDIFNYSQAIKINMAEKAFLKRLALLSANRAHASRKNSVFTTSLNSVYDNIVSIGTALLLLLISDKIRNGSFSIGSFTLFIFLLGYVSNLTRLFGTTLTNFKSSTIALNRIQEIIGDNYLEKLTRNDSLYLKEPPPSGMKKRSIDPLETIELRNLSYTYPGSKSGIRNISFSMRKGTVTVVIGKMGAGKTTLLRVILGLLPKDFGDISWNGKPIDMGEADSPASIAYTPQVPYLFSESIKENILYGSSNEQQLSEALRLAIMDEELAALRTGARHDSQHQRNESFWRSSSARSGSTHVHPMCGPARTGRYLQCFGCSHGSGVVGTAHRVMP
nr:ABC transporter ATP-binding protein [Paenibacillus eucommiae]